MTNLHVLATYITGLHDTPDDIGISSGEMHDKLVEALDDLGLGDMYRDYASAIDADEVA